MKTPARVEPFETPRLFDHGHVYTGPKVNQETALCRHCGCRQGSQAAQKLCTNPTLSEAAA
jgi:hypothetical protein